MNNLVNNQPIRVIALALILDAEGRLLVDEMRDPTTGRLRYRPLGGGVERGEAGAVAVTRELLEETGYALANVRSAGALENIFTVAGVMGHEIVLLFHADFADAAPYAKNIVIGAESDGEPIRAVRKSRAFFDAPNAPPLYPDGLLNLPETWESE